MKVGPATGSWSVVEVDEKFHGGVADGLKVEGAGRRVCGSRGRLRLFSGGIFFFEAQKRSAFRFCFSFDKQKPTTRISFLWFPAGLMFPTGTGK